MDSLATIQARLKELIDAKIERRQALVDEIAAIDAELADARRVLNGWRAPEDMPAAAVATPAPVAVVAPAPPKKVAPPVRMHREECIAFIRSKGGPVHWREVLDRFGIQDGRASAMLRIWVKDGYLMNCGDGFFNVPGPVPVETSA